MLITCMAIVVNICLNYVFIFGHFGAPALGAPGAAIATLIARSMEAAAIILVIYLGKSPIAGHIREMFGYSKEFLRQFARTTVPVIANEFTWGCLLYTSRCV